MYCAGLGAICIWLSQCLYTCRPAQLVKHLTNNDNSSDRDKGIDDDDAKHH